MRRLFPAAVLLLVTVGCSGGTEPTGAPDGSPAPSPLKGSPSPDPTATATAQPPGSATTVPAPQPKGSGSPGGTTGRNTLPITLTLNKTCASVGDTMIATVKTEPDTAIGIVVEYSEPEDTDWPDFHWVPREANKTGEATYAWEITPTKPYGPAKVRAVAGNAEHGGVTEARFRVAARC